MPSDAPRAGFAGSIDAPDSHPNLPRRGLLAIMFGAIVLCGVLGGAIGYGLVRTACPSTPTVAERLLEQTVPGYHAHTDSCDPKLLGGSLIGTALTALGAGVVAMLMLRAQAEWRAHPAGRVLDDIAGRDPRAAGRAPPVRTSPVRKPRSGGTPPRT